MSNVPAQAATNAVSDRTQILELSDVETSHREIPADASCRDEVIHEGIDTSAT